MIAPWLQRHLEATGRWNRDGISRDVASRTCPGCGAWVLQGLDADRCAIAATVDPTPTDAAGELLALLAGRPTYELVRSRTTARLDHRHQFAVAARPPDGTRDVHAAHACGTPELPTIPSAYREPITRQELPHDPPF